MDKKQQYSMLKRILLASGSVAAIEWALRAHALDAARAANDALKPGQGCDLIGAA